MAVWTPDVILGEDGYGQRSGDTCIGVGVPPSRPTMWQLWYTYTHDDSSDRYTVTYGLRPEGVASEQAAFSWAHTSTIELVVRGDSVVGNAVSDTTVDRIKIPIGAPGDELESRAEGLRDDVRFYVKATLNVSVDVRAVTRLVTQLKGLHGLLQARQEQLTVAKKATVSSREKFGGVSVGESLQI